MKAGLASRRIDRRQFIASAVAAGVALPAALDGASDAGPLLKESAAAAGIDITVRRVPSDGFWSNGVESSPARAS